MNYVLTAVDTSGIQSYIFGSNRLRENVGASEHVRRATTEWVWETLNHEHLRVNRRGKEYERDDAKRIEDGELDAEVLYAAGGNALILFKDAAQATNWAKRLSTKALTDAPGLTLLIAHSKTFDWNPAADDLAANVTELFENGLDTLKRTRTLSAPLLGLGVTASCQSTGLVATRVDEIDAIRVSREVAAKTAVLKDGNDRLFDFLDDFRRAGRQPPTQLDDLNPNKGERSYIAVIHADGNGIGKLFSNVWNGKTNREGVTAVRELSDKVAKAGERALQRALACLVDKPNTEGRFDLIPPYQVKDRQDAWNKEKPFLPVRPLVYGGDDLTIVCDGRLGVGLAARYLYEFERVTGELFGTPFTAAAGVAIVKTHYPFARAYGLAEQLCDRAKRETREHSMLDWHVAMSGTLANIGEIREREYQVPQGHLEMRPVYLHATDRSWRSWHNIEQVVAALTNDANWAGKRNKIKQLREVLRDGEQAVGQFRDLYRTGLLPGYENTAQIRNGGWRDHHCGYFDPIEIIDLYVPPAAAQGQKPEEARWLPTS